MTNETISSIVELIFKIYFKIKFSNYGKLANINFNIKEKKALLSILLNGESTPINFELLNIRLSSENEKDYLTFDKVEISREWINDIVNDHFVNLKKSPKIWLKKIQAKLLRKLMK